ncbi:hypothetical protein OS133_17720 [Shewanella fidelis]|uniref:Uncharacterized protein n=1 Tax=Shewanella fidelis TaxID=173509 RepID=A0AAW8NSB6_9GAMM|nr:hypothetical protein [Shewanella fidelis]MDR8525456.1 hypothetical protein [Shewanella fidelis]MDW4816895.1 hypothetical protein [Shewanella fidelis]MDW4825690.1 hypothetical protein [Shewanella fidelis]
MNIEKVLADVQQSTQGLESVWQDYQVCWREVGFTKTQVGLWLASIPMSTLQQPRNPDYVVTPDIAAHLVSLLQQAGGRMPLALVLKKLPAGITTSEQQIRKLAQQHAQLDIKGPLLILVN